MYAKQWRETLNEGSKKEKRKKKVVNGPHEKDISSKWQLKKKMLAALKKQKSSNEWHDLLCFCWWDPHGGSMEGLDFLRQNKGNKK